MILYLDDRSIVVPGRWVFCEPGAEYIPYFHRYASASWDEGTEDYEDFGDVRMVHYRTIPNQAIPGLDGKRWCGDQRMWEEGCFKAEAGRVELDELGRPLCCLPPQDRPGGDSDGGEAIQERGLWQDAHHGDADDGQAVQVASEGQLALGGDGDGGEAVQEAGLWQLGDLGEADDGEAAQDDNLVQVGAGGDSDGGEAVQEEGLWQLAVGGDSDGGEAVQESGEAIDIWDLLTPGG